MIPKLKPYPKMKDSGVDWLGEVPEHWEIKRGKVLFKKMDRPVRGQDEVITCFRDGMVTLRKYRRTSGFTESLKEIGYQGIRIGDLVIHQMDAFAGAIGVSNSDGKGSPVYSVCSPVVDANPHYFAFQLREMSRRGWIQALSKGIRERSTDFRYGTFGSQELALPPLPEQAAIVRYLDYMDQRIRKYIRARQKLIKLLEEQKQAIIHQAVTRGLDPNVKLKPSGVEWLGDIPEHWEVMPLGYGTESIQTGPFGSQVHNSDYVLNQTPIINPSHLVNGRIFPDRKISLNEKKVCELERHKLLAGDIVLARRGELGRCGLVTDLEEGWICGTGSIRLRPNKTFFISNFLVQMFNLKAFRNELSLSSVGSTMDNLSAGRVSSLRFPCPRLNEQEQILTYIDIHSMRISTMQDNLAKTIENVREYRTRLIADVVTGKVDVREIVKELPEELEEADFIEGLDELEEPDMTNSELVDFSGEMEDE